MVYANDFICDNDSSVIQGAIENRNADGIVVITPRCSETEPERDYWLLDRAILLPANTTIILQNCTIKLSDKCRDNFFRSANCGIGIELPERIENIHIRGEGLCTLLGADHPRATGDGSKILANPCPYDKEEIKRLGKWEPEQWHDYSYGTDAGKCGESQYGDWRGIGILLANVERFSIENLRIVDSHGWGISLEACANGIVSHIEFNAHMNKMIDGLRSNMENQDGVDLRNGCHHIVIAAFVIHLEAGKILHIKLFSVVQNGGDRKRLQLAQDLLCLGQLHGGLKQHPIVSSIHDPAAVVGHQYAAVILQPQRIPFAEKPG